MIIVFFPIGCRASYIFYLLTHRSDRAVLTFGDALSFSALRLLLDTENPVTTGAVCFATDIAPERALAIAERWMRECMLGGADVSVIPRLFVVHREPCPEGGYRIAVHWIVANVHLGLGKSIRPYVHARDFNRAILPWQELVNLHQGWPQPTQRKAEIKFARSHTSFEKSVVEVVRHGLNVRRATGPFDSEEDFQFHLADMIENFNADGVWRELAGADGGSASEWPAIMKQNDHYALRFQNSVTVPVCRWGTQGSRRAVSREAARAAGENRRNTLRVEGHATSFEEIARERAHFFKQLYGADWSLLRDIHSDVRNLLGGVQVGSGGIQPANRGVEGFDASVVGCDGEHPVITPEI